jgi:large subunit ribosomal protein L4
MPKLIKNIKISPKTAILKKPAVKKTVVAKKAKETVVKKAVTEKVATEIKVGTGKLLAEIVDVTGKLTEKVSLPEKLFDVKVNKTLITQAIRVYLANQREGAASTKTRGEVEGSTRKIYRQKGTGRARHGAIRAPIFVGGGIVFGPKPRDYNLTLTQKMRDLALAGTITLQYQAGNMIFVTGLNSISPKTKMMVKALKDIKATESVLILTGKDNEIIKRTGRNISQVTITNANCVNPYLLLSHKKIVVTDEAIPVLTETFIRK